MCINPAFLLFAAFFAIQVLAEDVEPERFKKFFESSAAQKCMESTAFKPDFKPGDITPEKMCFIKCLMTEKGFINEDGDIDESALDDASFPIPEDKKPEIRECISKTGKIQSCEDMGKLMECMPPMGM